jgi:DNA-directed RNA polymerase subunit RPC12/RpoP
MKYKEEIECPKCKELISYLDYSVSKNRGGSFHPDSNYEEDYDDDSDGGITYFCPECGEEITDDENEAYKLFEVKDELKELIDKVEEVNNEKNT